jgi:predicted nucleic-acid-binding protein
VIALDTNVLARWILLDDDDQTPIARRLLAEPCWLSWTVLLETAWLLASRAKLARSQIAEILDTVIAMPTVHVDRRDNLHWALERYRAGGDIADMFHIASSGPVSAFISFEKHMARKAGPSSPVPVHPAQ